MVGQAQWQANKKAFPGNICPSLNSSPFLGLNESYGEMRLIFFAKNQVKSKK